MSETIFKLTTDEGRIIEAEYDCSSNDTIDQDSAIKIALSIFDSKYSGVLEVQVGKYYIRTVY